MAKYFAFYKSGTARTRFYLYQGRQRALEEMANILVDDGKKYNRTKRKNTKRNRKRRKKVRKKRAGQNECVAAIPKTNEGKR